MGSRVRLHHFIRLLQHLTLGWTYRLGQLFDLIVCHCLGLYRFENETRLEQILRHL